MNDSDLLLESQLRHFLDPIVAAPVPTRRRRDLRPNEKAPRQGAFRPLILVAVRTEP
jgi:hypothetical protein